MLCGEWQDLVQEKRDLSAFQELGPIVSETTFLANLETTLMGDEGPIEKSPLVIATAAEVARALELLSVDLVSLANNHSFDCHESGFRATRALLDRLGIAFFGAGETQSQAEKPVVLSRGGVTVGFLGYVDPDTRPSHLASKKHAGANSLDQIRALEQVAKLCIDCDHVVVSLHWGVEFSSLVSPQQVRFARSLIEAGATLVLGHHAHVIQGVESFRHGLIAYGLGNLTTTDFFIESRRAIRQTRRTRSSLVVRVDLTREAIKSWNIVPVRFTGGNLLVDDPVARSYLDQATRALARGVSESRWKRQRFIDDVLLRSARKLHPAVIRSLRPYHFRKFFQNMLRSSSGRGPA